MQTNTINHVVKAKRFSSRGFGRALRFRGAKLVASTLGLALAFTGLTVATTAAPALADGAGQPFSCTSPTFFAQAGDATTTQLYTGTFATATGQSTWTPLGALNNTTANNYNAMALNPINKYLYGVVISGALVKIDSAGNVTPATASGQTTPTALGAAPNTLWDTGAFDPSGNYYVADGNAGTTTIYKITGLADATPTAVRSTITLPASISFADLTWKDGYLWGHSYGTGSGTNFYRIDVSTPTASVVTINSAIIPAAAYGAAYTITNGNLSFISNNTMYQVAVANSTSASPTVSLVNSVSAPTNSRADASNCLDVQNADLKITKTGPSQVAQGATVNWTVTVHNNGPGTSSGWVVKDTLPSNVTSPTATSSNATCVIAAPTITCSGGTLANGADAVINVSAVAPSANTTITNSATIQGYEVDPTAANSTSNVTTNVGNQPLTLVNDSATTAYVTPINVNVTSNDTFTGGGVTAVSTPSNGTASINADGTVKYTPNANFSGTDTFTYTVTDGTGQTSTATVTMTVTPLAVDDTATTNAATQIDIPVTANDKGQTLTLGSVAAGANTHGTVTVNGNSARYTPTSGFSGTATFTYVLNGAGGSSNATVTVTVKPTAGNDALTTNVETPVTDTNWASNDNGSSLTVTGKTNGTNGTVSIATGAPVYTPNTGFSGNDSFTYTVTDASGQTATATVTVIVNPKANNDSATTPAETAVTVPVLTNDKGTSLTVTGKTDGAHGTVSIATGTPVYTPAAAYSGPDSFTYTITDGAGRTSTATVAVTVTPVAKNDAATTEIGDPVSIPVRSNDLGTGLTVTAKTDGAHGTVSIATGTPVYTPAAGYTGSDSFTYTVTDSSGQTSTATVTVSVTPGPTAANDTATTPAQTPVTIDVLANDTGTGLTVTGTSQGSNGSVSISTGTPVYTPNNGFSGTDTFTYTGKDAAGHPISATVTVTVTPVAVNDSDTVNSGASKTVNVVANDLGTGLAVTGKTNGSHGTVSIATGTPVYTSTASYSGTDTFTYTVTDSSGKKSTATVTMTILPVAVNDAVTTPVNSAITVGVLANDLGSGLTVTGKTNGSHGTVSIATGTPVYTPTTDYSGTDTFTYTITDSNNKTSTATVTVTITPQAVNDSATVNSGSSVTVSVLGNDHGSSLSVTGKTNGAHGTVVITGGLPVYTANNGYSGTDAFTYTVTDSSGQTATATVNVTVKPVAVNDTASTVAGDPVTIDATANDLGVGLSITSKTDGAHGTVSIVSGKLVYTPAAGYVGPDSFTYTITDSNGQTSTATVNVTVAAGPSAANDAATTPAKTAVTIDVLANDTGTGLTLTSTTNGSNGTVAIVGNKAVYTPTGSFSGTDTFTYTGKDSTNHPISATVTVTVTPVAVDDTATVVNGGSIAVNVRSNDTGSGLTVTGKTNGTNGTVVITGGSPVYSPSGDFSGTDTFTYTVTDSSNQTATATVTVTVTPRAVNDTDTTTAGTPVTTDVLANDHGTGLTVTGKTNGTNGSVAIVGGKPVYTPAAGFSGADSYTYTVTDSSGGAATATVSVTVKPKAVDDSASVVSGDAVSIPVKANDVGTGLTVVSATNGAHGTVSIATGTPVYTSTGGYTGTDTFTYTISDGTSTATATVTVTITAGPAGVDDAATTDAGTPVTIDVLANDSGTGLSLTGKTNGSNGSVAIVSGKAVYTPNAGFSGVDTFTYTGQDSTGHPISATVTVTVDPKAVNDTATVTAGSSVSVPVLVNDLGSALSVTGKTNGAHGTVSIATGSPVYTAAPDYSGSDSFTYTITDGTGNTSTATVSVTVNPKAVADTATTPAGTDVTVPVLDNDLGSSLNVTATTDGGHGTVTVSGGLPVYSPAAGFSGQDTFTYTITDGAAHTSTATVTVTVTPKAKNDTATTVAGDSVSVNVKANDLGTGLTVTGSTDGAHGSVSIATGTPVYTPSTGFTGTDTFTYTVTDSNGKSDTATVTVTVTPGPTGVDDTATTPARTPVTIDVLANDTGTGLTITGKTNGSHGTVAIVSGKLVYTPTGTFSGEDTFTYTGQDGAGHPFTATVTVTVTPVAKDDSASVVTGGTVTVTVLPNDIGTGLTVTDTTDGAHGTVAIVGGKPVYTSDNAGFSGTDTFTYEVTDDNGEKSTATVTVTVGPKAVDDTTTTDAKTPVTVDVLANDLGNGLDVLSVTDGAHGTVSIIGGKPVYTPTGSYSGSDTFTYTVEDANGTTSTATVSVTVNPVAKDDSAGVVSGEDVTIPVLTNDIGTGLTITDTTDGAHGTVTIVAGKIVYSSDPGYTGTDTFTYQVTDSTGGTSTATVTVTVASGPMGVDDTAATVAGSPVTIDVLANDIGTGLTLTSKTNGADGTVSIVSGQVVYTPAAGFSGTDTFTYTGKDAGGDPITATVTVTVDPKAKNDTATVDAGGSVTVDVLANDLGTDLAITEITDGAHGTVDDSTGTPVYTADPDFSGTDTFSYTATDGEGNSSTATVTVTVKPKANADAKTTPANTAVTVDVLANDTGSSLTITAQNDGLHGSVALVGGKLVYTPNSNYSGTDTFTYTITDSHGTTSTVTITVTPTAGDDTATTNANTPVTVTVLTNDHGRTLVVSHLTDGAHGTVTIVGGKPVYTPDTDFSGVDTFTYLVTDASGQTTSATVTVTVQPKAVGDTATTVADQPVTVDVTANDAGTGLDVSGVTDGAHGTVAIDPTGTVTYTPDAGYSGPDTFTYTVTDGTTTSTATVTVTVKPSAVDDATTTTAGTAVSLPPMTNDAGSSITVTGKTNGSHGTVVIQPGGTNVTYTPAAGFSGTDTFTYTITDSKGQTATATVTVTVTPVAVDDSKTTGVNAAVTINAIANDLGTGISITDAANGSHGTVAIAGGKLVYTPDADYSGTDSFVYTITDASGQTTTATVHILVTPLAPDDSATTPTGTAIDVDVLANDSGTGLTVTSVTQPSHGTVTIVGNEVHYVPAPGFSGQDTFTYTSTDSNGKTAVGTVTIFVTPVAANNTATATSGSSVTLNPSGNDTGSGLTTTAVGTPSSGSVVLNPDGTVTFTPDPGFSGTVTIPYTTTDTSGQTADAIITITIKPAAKKDHGHTAPSKPITTPVLGNDSGSGLHVTGHTNPKHGSVVVNADGTITYTPDAGFSGTDTYTYTVTDSSGQSVTTTVTIVVDPPVGSTGIGTSGLAFTGSDPTTALTLASLLLALGALAVALALRRRRPAGRHL